MHPIYRDGFYSCHVLLKNGQLLNSTQQIDVTVHDEEQTIVNSQSKVLPPEMLEGRVNDDLFIECWSPDSKATRWYRSHQSITEIISLEPVLIFRNASARLSGEYECRLEDNFGLVRSYRIQIYIEGGSDRN